MSSDLEIAVQYVDFILRWVSLLNNKIVNPKKKQKIKSYVRVTYCLQQLGLRKHKYQPWTTFFEILVTKMFFTLAKVVNVWLLMERNFSLFLA